MVTSLNRIFFLPLLLVLLLPLVGGLSQYHWAAVTELGGVDILWRDAAVWGDAAALGGSFAEYPLIGFMNMTNSGFWISRIETEGVASAVELVAIAGELYIAVGGWVFDQSGLKRPYVALMNMSGKLVDSDAPLNITFEDGGVTDLLLGRDGNLYVLGYALVPETGYTPFYSRYNLSSLSIDFTMTYPGMGRSTRMAWADASALLLSNRDGDTFILEVGMFDGVPIQFTRVSSDSFTPSIYGYDVAYEDSTILIGGRTTAGSAMLIMDYPGYNPLWLGTQTLVNITGVEFDGMGYMYFIGSGRALNRQNTSGVIVYRFNQTPSRGDYLDYWLIDSRAEDSVAGSDIDDQIVIAGYGDSFGYAGRDGLALLYTDALGNITFPGCQHIGVFQVDRLARELTDFSESLEVLREELGGTPASPEPLNLSSMFFEESFTCIGYDPNNPPIIPEYTPLLLAAVAVTWIAIYRILRRIYTR